MIGRKLWGSIILTAIVSILIAHNYALSKNKDDRSASNTKDCFLPSPVHAQSWTRDIAKRKSHKTIPGFVDRESDLWLGKEIALEKEEEGFREPLFDTSPPNPPANVIADNEGMHIVACIWDPPEDPGPCIDYYVFGVGTRPGTANVKWWQIVYRRKAYFYPLEFGREEGETLYFSVRACIGISSWSELASSNPVELTYELLGDPENNVQVDYADFGFDTDGVTPADGWDSGQIARFEHFTSRMLPILRELYGPPARDFTVTLVRDLYYSNSNIYFPQYNEIHMDDSWNPQLLTHELIHAFRDNVTVTSDEYWRYDDTLSGFEEGFAQGGSYACMNRYIEAHPEDPHVTASEIWQSDFHWDYDFQNVAELRTTDFWSDSGGMGLSWRRYEMAAAAMRKIHIENDQFYRLFNEEWYSRINADPDLRSSRDLAVGIIGEICPTVEGIAAQEWIQHQYVFDCRTHEGKKVWLYTQHYPHWADYRINQRIHYYETFPGGSDWSYWDAQTLSWVYHHLNGSVGEAKMYDFHDTIFWQGELLIEPVENPPDWFGFGRDDKNLTNIDTPPYDEPEDWVLGIHDLGLYRMSILFDEASKTIHRVLGDELVDSRGIWGGIKGARGGVIYIDHEAFPSEEGMPVVNGAFHGQRTWAGVYNESTRRYDTVPGRVFITYIDEQDSSFHSQQNIDRGSWDGNQIFLLDFGIADLDGDGWHAGEDCDDEDPLVHPAAIEGSEADTCGDGKDNDCDGMIDAADPDCPAGPCLATIAPTSGRPIAFILIPALMMLLLCRAGIVNKSN